MSEFDPDYSAGHPGTGEPHQAEPGAPGGDTARPQPVGYPPNTSQPAAPPTAGFSPSDTGSTHTGTTHIGAAGPFQVGHPSGWPTGPWPQQYAPPVGSELPRRRRAGRTVGISVGVIALSVLAGIGIARFAWGGNNANQAFGSVASAGGGNSSSIDASAVAQKVDPGLVDINTVLSYQNEQAAGTGIVLTAGGEILTNNHVVEGATSIKVTDIGNGRTYNATVVGYDRTQDVAVLQLQDASGLQTAALGDSSKISAGQAVAGLGNAGGVGGTPSVAAGTVTALNQSITASDDSGATAEQLSGLIQINANIQPGDSGGALVNSAGQVIGMDTAASAGSQNGQGKQSSYGQDSSYGQGSQGQQGQGATQGYAIPINKAISLAHQIIGGQGSSTIHIGASAFLGVSVSDGGQAQQGQFGQGAPGASSDAQIVGTVANGPAQQAGLAEGDVINSVNGAAVDSASALTSLMDTVHPGDKVAIGYTDAAGQQHTVTVTPTSGPIG